MNIAELCVPAGMSAHDERDGCGGSSGEECQAPMGKQQIPPLLPQGRQQQLHHQEEA